MEDFRKLPYLRMTIAESMRLYPQPPILIRRWAAGSARRHAYLRSVRRKPSVALSLPLPPSLPASRPVAPERVSRHAHVSHSICCRFAFPPGPWATTCCPPG